MRRFRRIADLPVGPARRAVAIGAFDGVHLGHQAIIRSAVANARERGIPSMVVTFHPNPLKVLRPHLKTTVLTGPELRADLIERLGVDELLEIPFTRAFSHIRWDRFVEMMTDPPIGAEAITVGRNFRFGHGGVGTSEMLGAAGRARGIRVQVPEMVDSVEGKPISSTRIRRLVGHGQVGEVIPLLGRPHIVEGPVVAGDGRGRGLGIPTANVALEGSTALPALGVYAGRVQVAGGTWPAAINVGHAPTFRTGTDVRVEALLLDYPGDDLYGQHARVGFLERLRGEERFPSAEALVAQITNDAERARAAAAGTQGQLC